MTDDVVLLSGCRTPIGTFGGALKDVPPVELGALVIHNGERLGVAVMMWDGDAYRFNALPALTPFLLILICIVAAAVPLTAHVVRKAVAPLDELTRIEMQNELLRVWSARRKTVVFVTHSIWEGLILADRIVVLAPRPGRIVLEQRIDLARPRRRSDPTLLALYEDIWSALQ